MLRKRNNLLTPKVEYNLSTEPHKLTECLAVLRYIAIVPKVYVVMDAEWQVRHIKQHVEAFLEAYQRVEQE